MKTTLALPLPLLLFFLLCFSSPSTQAQDDGMWEIDRHKIRVKENQRKDSIALENKDFSYPVDLYLKTQFPVQHALGLRFTHESGIELLGSFGIFSRSYTLIALEFLEDENSTENERQEFFKDRLRSGTVIEFGAGYFHFPSGFSGSLTFQFQRFSISATSEELINNLDFGDELVDDSELQDALEDSETLEDFYYNETVYPTIRPIQLVLNIEKKFRFRKVPRISLSVAFSFSMNIATRTSIEANSTLGTIIMDNYVNPTLKQSSTESFGTFNLPSLTLQLNIGLGKLIRK